MRSTWLIPFFLITACAEGEPELTTTPIPAIDHDALFVVNGAHNSLSVIDASSNAKVGDILIEGASYPHHVYLSPDRGRLAVAVPGIDLSGGHSAHTGHGAASAIIAGVLVLDATTGAVIASRVLDTSNHNAVFTPDGREIWTALGGSPGEVLVMDPATLDTITTISVGDGPSEITFSANGSFAFVANGGSGDVSVIDPAAHTIIHTVDVGTNPVGAWPGRDGIMYVDNEGSKTISAVDGSSHEIIRTYELGFTPGFAAVAPNGDLWVTDSDAGRVVFYAANSDQLAGELATGAGAHAITFSDDGARAYVTNQSAGSTSVLEVATKALITNVTVGSKPNGLVFRAR